MRADRLLTIVLLLQNYGQLTTRELASRLGVSARTVHRDMDALSAAGVPVVGTRGVGGGWSLLAGYRTNLTGLTRDEAQSLLLARSTPDLSDLGLGPALQTAAEKLLAALPGQTRAEAARIQKFLHIDGLGWHQAREECPHLSTVQEAVWQERCLRITYRRHDGPVERTIHPLGLVAKRGVWYVVGGIDEGLRSYRVSRIESAHVLDEPVRRPAGFNLAAHWEAATRQFQAELPRYPARLAVTPALLAWLERERYVRVVEVSPAQSASVTAGWLEVAVEFHTLEHACGQVLSFGANAIVLDPCELADQVAVTAKAIAALYEAGGGARP